jgi:hypothetical protein
MTHELISLTDWPTMPWPLHSEDEGEAWIWSDFVLILQKNPDLCEKLIEQMRSLIGKGDPSRQKIPALMEYPYAVMVYYKKHKNPHGPSSSPILCAGIERANYDAGRMLQKMKNAPIPDFVPHGKGPLMVGLFRAKDRKNLGVFDAILSRDTARETLFGLIRDELGLEGEPERIGVIRSILGHPETGWEAMEVEPEETPQKKGCLSVLVCAATLIPVIGICYKFFC